LVQALQEAPLSFQPLSLYRSPILKGIHESILEQTTNTCTAFQEVTCCHVT